ncbi:MAG: dehydratase, partial [Actinophytocola sp.]|nr:dehydratase [Actinophytocola sp.]
MGRYYDDLSVGDTFTTPARTITEYDVAAFAGLSGDYNPVHTDREFATATSFGQPIAHGVLGITVATGLIARTGLFDGTAVAF